MLVTLRNRFIGIVKFIKYNFSHQMEDPAQYANYYHQQMTLAYENSQTAWKEGRKADAKKYSDEMKVYKEKMLHYNQLAKEKKAQDRVETRNLINEQVNQIITNGYSQILNYANSDYLKELNYIYVYNMKVNYENSQESFRSNKKADAKYYAELGKAYKILVSLSNDYLRVNKIQIKEKSKLEKEKQLRKILESAQTTSGNDYEIDTDCGDEREYASYFAQKMKEAFSLAENAWKNNDKLGAKKYSDQGNTYKEYMEYYNKKAATIAFKKNNTDKDSATEIDLHGLTVNEAYSILDEKIKQSVSSGSTDLVVITGKGLHSGKEGPKLKSMVVDYCQKRGISVSVDVNNEGVLIIQM